MLGFVIVMYVLNVGRHGHPVHMISLIFVSSVEYTQLRMLTAVRIGLVCPSVFDIQVGLDVKIG